MDTERTRRIASRVVSMAITLVRLSDQVAALGDALASLVDELAIAEEESQATTAALKTLKALGGN